MLHFINNIYVFSLVLVLISQNSTINLFSQEKLNYTIPNELKFKELENNYNSNNNIQFARFYPIGWSTDSKFAYITVFEEEDACGCIFSNLVIHNLLNDKAKCFTISNELDEYFPNEVPFDRIWHNKYNLVSKTLRDNLINPVDEVQIKSIPIIDKGDTLTLKMDTLIVDRGKKYVENLILSVHSSKLGIKKIFDDDLYGVYQINILGCLSSPYENRVAFIVAERCYGIEGNSPGSIRFRLIGCHLTKGFK